MTRWTRSILAAGMILVGVIAAFPRAAEAHGRIGFRVGIGIPGFFGGPFYGYPYCGFSPYWGPCYGAYGTYGPYASTGFQMGMAAAAGIGAVDLDVKPGAAEVWVDGRFVAEAGDLGGSPGLLWLKDGPHHLVIYKGGYRSLDEDISVQPGQTLDLKVRLEKGDSQAPGARPGAKTTEAN